MSAPVKGCRTSEPPISAVDAVGRKPSMNEVITIGVDLAKNVFKVHGVDAQSF